MKMSESFKIRQVIETAGTFLFWRRERKLMRAADHAEKPKVEQVNPNTELYDESLKEFLIYEKTKMKTNTCYWNAAMSNESGIS